MKALTEQQIKSIYNMYKFNNHNNEYILSLISIGEKKEAECLIRGMDKINNHIKAKAKKNEHR